MDESPRSPRDLSDKSGETRGPQEPIFDVEYVLN